MKVCAAPNSNDRVLVDCYASEMACAGGLSESVSYGWALDAFLADLTEFRARVRSVRPPSDVASLLQSASSTVTSSGTTKLPPFVLARRGPRILEQLPWRELVKINVEMASPWA